MFYYETHMHTSQGSACARSQGHEYIRAYQAAGYDGIFITDHFFQGNCAVPRNLSWRERVDRYVSGYRDAKAEGDRLGFDVFFGIEQNFDCDEYLIYGIDEEFLYAHPEIETWTRQQLSQHVHAAGGCVVQAHPFRERGYIQRIHIYPELVDAVEGINTANAPEQDALAVRYAQAFDKPITCGNDIHSLSSLNPAAMGATGTTRRLTSSRDFAEYILSRQQLTLRVPPQRGQWADGIRPNLPVICSDATRAKLSQFIDFSAP